MILGAGLAAATGGSSLLIGAGIGGLQAARTGSIGKGLMAGLGAWGGAGLAGGLVGAGASSVGQTASALGTPAATGAGSQASMLAAQNAGFGQAGLQSLGQSAAVASGATPVVGGVGSSLAAGLANPSASIAAMGGGATAAKMAAAAALPAVVGDPKTPTPATPDKDMGQRYSFTGNQPQATPAPDVPTYEDMLTKQGNFGRQQNYFATPTYTPINPSQAKDLYHFAGGGPVENMSNNATIGANTMYPMANMATSAFAVPYQDPKSTNMMAAMAPSGGGTVDAMSGEPNMQGTRLADGGIASFGFGGFLGDAVSSIGSAIGHIGKSDSGGSSEGWKKLLENMGGKQSVAEPAGYQYNAETQQYEPKPMAEGGLSDAHYNLGGYSDGGRLLRGPGDGVSDSIPATIGHKQPARLADGEFVVPARIVSELGNGSTEAGARKLYAMMERVQAARKKTVGKDKVAHNSRADKYLPA
jgi:hypothetical protein